MSDWTSGYRTDIGYSFGYFRELNPLHVELSMLYAGFNQPAINTACEIGFGQGVSINLHASGSTVQWHGTDFNPDQALFAQQLASTADNGAHLHADSFEEFLSRTDLPEFDFICLHGIWSWISAQNRTLLVNLFKTRLKLGGILYVSYNTLAGHAGFIPMRNLLNQYANTQAGKIDERIQSALDFADSCFATSPGFAALNPAIKMRLQQLRKESPEYLAHEYFNHYWEPTDFNSVAESLQQARLQYACSADPLDQVEPIRLSSEQIALLDAIEDSLLRESTRDLLLGRKFRKDYWVKGASKLSANERHRLLRQQRVMLTCRHEEIALKFTLQQKVNLREDVFTPIVHLLADLKPVTLGELESKLKSTGVDLEKIADAVMTLCGRQHLAPVHAINTVATTQASCMRINQHLISKSPDSAKMSTLASPMTGGGIMVEQFSQLFLLAMQEGHTKPAEIAAFVWQLMSQRDMYLRKGGTQLESDSDHRAELNSMAKRFIDMQLPHLKALQVVS